MPTAAFVIAVIALTAGAEPPTDKQSPALQFELADGTVITGRIDAKTIAIRISSGNVLNIPVAALRELTVGLNDRGRLVRRVEALVKALDSDKTREAAQRELIALGPTITPILKRHIASDVLARRGAVGEVLRACKTWSANRPYASKALSRPLDLRSKVKADVNTFAGTLIAREFRIASQYGPVVVKLDDILRIRQAAQGAPDKFLGRWDIELRDGTHLRGMPAGPPLRVKTRYGTMVLPLARIRKADIAADGKSVRTRCWGSDRIVGAFGPGTIISLKTDKGGVELSAGKIAMMTNGLLTLKGHLGWVFSLAFSPDGKRLASGSTDYTIKLWDPAAGKELITLKGHSNWVFSVAFSPDGKTLASGSVDKTIKLWDTTTGKEVATLKGHSSTAFSVAFSPDGKTLASGGHANTIKIWDIAAGKELITFKGHLGSVFSVAFSPDGKTLASAGGDGIIKLWDPATGKELIKLKGSASRVVFLPDGRRLASAGRWDSTARIWDSVARKELLAFRGHSDEVRSIALSPDGETLASGSFDKTVKLWDTTGGKELITLKRHSGKVYSVAFSPDGKRLASGSDDKTIKIWDAIYWTKAAK